MSKKQKLSSDDLAAKWQEAKDKKVAAKKCRERAGAEINLLKPPGEKEVLGPEILRGLAYVFQITGDPIFSDAIEALKAYGFDQRTQQRAAAVFDHLLGSHQMAHYEYMRHWIDTHKHKSFSEASVSTAARMLVTDERFNQGSSFETDCETQRRGYSKWVEDGYPNGQLDGYFGRTVWVVPRDGNSIKIGSFQVPATGVAKPYDLFLRRLFLDGIVLIAKLPEQ